MHASWRAALSRFPPSANLSLPLNVRVGGTQTDQVRRTHLRLGRHPAKTAPRPQGLLYFGNRYSPSSAQYSGREGSFRFAPDHTQNVLILSLIASLHNCILFHRLFFNSAASEKY